MNNAPDQPDPIDELRRRLAEQARHAPTGEGLTERILAQAVAGHRVEERPDNSTPWLRLLSVAAAVIALAGIAVVIARHDSGSDRDTADPVPSVTASGTPSAAVGSASPTPSTSSPSVSVDATAPTRITVPTLSGVRIRDITFTGGGQGWALATADCLSGSGTCSALLHTDTDGRSWQGRPNTPFTVTRGACSAADCVTGIRFATDDVGYVFSRSALFVTTDGAKTWTRQKGGADALETLDGTVIRIRSDAGSCPPGCDYTAQVADVGSTQWRDVTLPGQGPGDGVTLSRSGSDAYLLATGNPAGGAEQATSTLWTSSDDGRSWRNRGEPCDQTGGEVDAQTLTTAADGTVVVVCQRRGGGRAQSIAISTDEGTSFTTGPAELGAATISTIGAASSRTLLVSSDRTYRSTDGGRRFAPAASIGLVSYLGFSSGRDAHAISADGRTIYTTTDAGRNWRAVPFE